MKECVDAAMLFWHSAPVPTEADQHLLFMCLYNHDLDGIETLLALYNEG
jgi:hypothetical protein